MNRSKCVVCGKVRFLKYLIQVIDLSGSNRWICSRSVSNSFNYLEIDGIHYNHSPCHLSFLKFQYDIIQKHITNYQFSKILFPLCHKIICSKNVIPELTFLQRL